MGWFFSYDQILDKVPKQEWIFRDPEVEALLKKGGNPVCSWSEPTETMIISVNVVSVCLQPFTRNCGALITYNMTNYSGHYNVMHFLIKNAALICGANTVSANATKPVADKYEALGWKVVAKFPSARQHSSGVPIHYMILDVRGEEIK